MARPFLLNFKPGTMRDGTQFDGDRYFDLLWCRFRAGRPRKIGGFKLITDQVLGLPRRIHMFYDGLQTFIHVGSANGIQQFVTDRNGNLISSAVRTPLVFSSGANIGFTMDAIFDTTSGTVQLIVHSVPDLTALPDTTRQTPFIGDIRTNTLLVPFGPPSGVGSGGVWTQPSIAGGIVCVQPFVFDFDFDGLVQWSAPNLPLTLGVVGGSIGAGQARISAQKIVHGHPLRGGGAQAPAAVFWSLSEVITATFIGGLAAFSFNTVSPSSSILSSDSVVEYDGLYFWAGIDRFMVFNGTVVEVPNTQNQDWFFDNLTSGFEAQTFAFKVPRFGEIWWCAAMFGSQFPNYAVIFNLRENAWYDTPLPNGFRTAGHFAQGLRFPVMGGFDTNDSAGPFKIWAHEVGTDEVNGNVVKPIRSFFETGYFGGPKNDPPDDRGMSIQQLEPDFVQTGDLITYLIGAPNVRAEEHNSPVSPILELPTVPQEEFPSYVPTQSQRLTRLHVESNVIGGNYIGGRQIVRGDPSEKRTNS